LISYEEIITTMSKLECVQFFTFTQIHNKLFNYCFIQCAMQNRMGATLSKTQH